MVFIFEPGFLSGLELLIRLGLPASLGNPPPHCFLKAWVGSGGQTKVSSLGPHLGPHQGDRNGGIERAGL